MADIILPGTGRAVATDLIGGVYHQRVKIQHGADGSATDVSTASPLPTDDIYLEIARGNRTGLTAINKFGENPTITTATDPEDIWDYGGLYTFSTTADIDQISSSNDGDTQVITVVGLDSSWEEVTQTKTLTGQTPATLDTALIRVYRAYNSGTSDFAGDIYITTNGAALTDGVPDTASTVRAMIRDGNNQTLMCIYSVPAGCTAYFRSGYVAIAGTGGVQAQVAKVTWRARPFGGVFQVKSQLALGTTGNSTWNYTYGIPVALPAKTDILIRCDEVTATMGISGGFDLVLES
jgi:hypothetical protein